MSTGLGDATSEATRLSGWYTRERGRRHEDYPLSVGHTSIRFVAGENKLQE